MPISQDLYQDIIDELKKHGDPTYAEKDKRYHKYDGYNSYGIAAPLLDRILRNFKTPIRELNCRQALEVAERFYASGFEEQLHVGTHVLTLKNDCLGIPNNSEYLDRLADNFMSWSTVDDFCGQVFQPLLSRYTQPMLQLIEAWNGSNNLWKQRASLVVFTRKIGESGQFTNEVLRLCDTLVHSKEDLIQKAIGWTLKDNLRGNKQKVLDYVIKLRQQGAPATITLYAIRDLTGEERQRILSIKPSQDL